MKDPKTEQMLESLMIDYVYVDDVSIDQVDAEQSLRNQARIEPPLYPETVTQYADAMKNGDQFPALVGYYNDDQKIVLTDGNHRLHGYKTADIDVVDVYIVDAAPDVLQALTYVANATHGRPSSEEERIHHAIHLRDLGYTNKEAARWVQLSEYKISTAWQLEVVRRRARKLGVHRGFENLKQSLRLKIGAISSDNTFKVLVTFLVNSKSLTTMEMATLIQQVKDASTEQTQLQTIEEFKDAKRNEQRTEGRTRHRQDARRQLLPHLGYIHQQDAEAVRNATLTPEQRDNLKAHVMKAMTFCTDLMKLLVEDEERATDGGAV